MSYTSATSVLHRRKIFFRALRDLPKLSRASVGREDFQMICHDIVASGTGYQIALQPTSTEDEADELLAVRGSVAYASFISELLLNPLTPMPALLVEWLSPDDQAAMQTADRQLAQLSTSAVPSVAPADEERSRTILGEILLTPFSSILSLVRYHRALRRSCRRGKLLAERIDLAWVFAARAYARLTEACATKARAA